MVTGIPELSGATRERFQRLSAHGRAAAVAAGICLGTVFQGVPVAEACAFHFYTPERTAIDWVIETERLVVARPKRENPFAYEVVEVLRGTAADVPIEQLVDSRNRTRLATHPDDGVLFAWDEQEREWRSIAYLTPAYRRTVEAVLFGMATWQSGYDPARFEMFEALQDHPEKALRDLALLEIDQAPYALLRTMDLRIPADALLADLWTPQGYPYQSIRILLLGLSEDEAARRTIHSVFGQGADRGWSKNLGAYATALIEMDGTAGAALLEQTFMSGAPQPLDTLEQVVEGFAIHITEGAPEMRQSLTDAIARLVQERPEAAPLVARQFGSRQNWIFAEQFAPLVAERKLSNASDLMTVAVYLAQAKAAGASRGSADARGG